MSYKIKSHENKFEKIEDLYWLYTGDWLGENSAYALVEKLNEKYRNIAYIWDVRDHDDHHDGYNVFIEFRDELGEIEFLMRECV